jgi:hypothetical protein
MTMQDEGFMNAVVAGHDAGEYEDADPGYLPTPLVVVPDPPAAEQPAEAKPEEGKPKAKPGDTWVPVDLAAVLAGTYETPQPTVGTVDGAEVCLFYPGRINSVFGDSGSGKSWLLAFVISQTIKAGRDAVVIDYEDSPLALAARLQQVGLSKEAIIQHLVYISPQERWYEGISTKHLEKAVKGRQVAVAVIDSTGEGMAQDGVNPNADEEVARWFQGAARSLANFGSAVVLIDHVVKSKESGRNAEFASGSHRKRASINGAAYYLEAIVSPSRENDGLLKLVVRKDRFGWRKHGSIAAEIKMVNGEDGSVAMSAVQPAAVTGDGDGDGWKPNTLMGYVCDALRDAGKPMSRSAIKRAVKGKATYIDIAIDELVMAGNCLQEDGDRGSKMVDLLRHMDDDPKPAKDGEDDPVEVPF